LYNLEGNPPVRPEQMKIPERPGQKLGFLDYLNFIWVILTRLPSFIANRPAVTDKRAIMVHL
jgi:carboxymethylenebutenolidase